MIQKGMTKDFQILTPYTDDAGASYVVTQIPVYSPPPLGIDPDKIPTGTSVISEPYVDTKPIKSTGNIQGGLSPECLKKWEQVLAVTKFESTQAMEDAKNRFMTDCMGSSTTGTSAIVEPEIVTPSGTSTTNFLPNLGGFLSSLTGGGAGGGGGATEEDVLTPNKKPFPYWIIAVAVVGGYLIFRKK